jgi:hypothetical protein
MQSLLLYVLPNQQFNTQNFLPLGFKKTKLGYGKSMPISLYLKGIVIALFAIKALKILYPLTKTNYSALLVVQAKDTEDCLPCCGSK